MHYRLSRLVAMTFLLCVVSLYSEPVSAADESPKKKGQVHFEPFEFAGETSDDYVYFTLFIKPTKQSHLLNLCKQEPRVREIVNQMLYGRSNLHKWGLKTPLMKKASSAMKKRINKAVNDDMVDEAYFIRGYFEFEQGPIEEPTIIPHPLSCKQIWFQAKSINSPDD